MILKMVSVWEKSFAFDGAFSCDVSFTIRWIKQQSSWPSILSTDDHCVIRWRHDMESFSTSLVLCEGNLPVTGGFPLQRASIVERRFFCVVVYTSWWTNTRIAGNSIWCSCDSNITMMIYIDVLYVTIICVPSGPGVCGLTSLYHSSQCHGTGAGPQGGGPGRVDHTTMYGGHHRCPQGKGLYCFFK